MGSSILNEIINLKSHKQMLEVECGIVRHQNHIFSRNQRLAMEREIILGNP